MMDVDTSALLQTAPPALTGDRVAGLVLRHYGLEGDLQPLTSERDQNLLLRTGDGRAVVVKIANPAEPRALTLHQCLALQAVAAADPALPVPRLVPARDGAVMVDLASGGSLRVVTWLDGTPLAGAARSDAQRRAIGRVQARLARAMAGLPAPPPAQALLWDLQAAAGLRPLLPAIADADLRGQATLVLDRLEAEALPALAALPRQAVHGDLNPHNILVDPDDPDRIAGVIDFGDMCHAPRVCDVAVAAAYQVDPAAPLASLTAFLAGVADEAPLSVAEARLLPALIAGRMVATLAIASWRAARYPGNAAYILRNVASARAGLAAVLALPPDALAEGAPR